MSLFSDEKPTLGSPSLINATQGYGGTYAGITLTAGDLPVFFYKDKDGTPHVLVLTDADTVAVRT